MTALSKIALSGLIVVLGFALSSCGSGSSEAGTTSGQPIEGAANVAGYQPDDEACERNKDAGTIVYISSYGYAAVPRSWTSSWRAISATTTPCA